jgi:predicted nucleic acid-binding protein
VTLPPPNLGSDQNGGGVVLVDSSLWIADLHRQGTLARHVEESEIATCPPVIQEVLQGIRTDHGYRITRSTLLSLAILESPMELEVFEHAAEIYRTGRKAGITAAPIDCLIAACAIRNHVTLLHSDRDFDAIARFTPLQSRYVR